MIITKVILSNIRSFTGTTEFEFRKVSNINTISGVNGSGKTTLFKSILLVQRVFFSKQLELFDNASSIKLALNKDLLSYLSIKNSCIKIVFELEGEPSIIPSISIVCKERSQNSIDWEMKCEQEDRIKEFWNIFNPQKIIVYVDSNRNINENDFTHEGISLKSSNKEDDLALDYIFKPDQIFSSIYERIINDYIRERVIPNTPRKDIPHTASKVLVHKLLRNLKITNFSGITTPNQFVLHIKPIKQSTNLSQYDLRNMSSGEKTIFYLIHFICYVKNIGMLIIDEPENNLHENLLSEFIDLLNQICSSNSFGNLILDISKEQKETRTQQDAHISSYYKQHKLSTVFLLTHSKNLIYHNFSIGSNYVINEGLKHLTYEDSEKELRGLGLSMVHSKVLFVEGKTENEFLESILDPYNIKVKSLGSCQDVIDTYKKYVKLSSHIKDVQFCFMIDKDTKGEEDIKKLQTTNTELFDKHFIILERHEIENYFLDPKLISELYKRHHSLFPEIMSPTEAEIKQVIKTFADKHKEKVILKTLQNMNQKCFGSVKSLVSSSKLPIETKEKYFSHIDESLSNSSIASTITTLKENYNLATESIKDWDNERWLFLCDGKIVFNDYVSSLVKTFSVDQKRLTKELTALASKENKFDAYQIIRSILHKFNISST